jgi:hypothetical protein
MKKYADNSPIRIIFTSYQKNSFMNQHLAVSLIVCYLTLSFVYSIVEKTIQWEKSKTFYKEHFKRSFLKNHVPAAILLVIILELICVGLNTVGLYRFIQNGRTDVILWGMLAVSFTLILLMTGQRIAQDYSGAMNITVYFILTVMGIFMLELV